METTTATETGFYDLTLEEFIRASVRQAEEVEVVLSLGEMWMQTTSGALSNGSQALGRLSFYHRRLTGALLVLRSWCRTSGYETTQPLSKHLQTWSRGSAPLMELIEAGVMCEFLVDQLSYLVPDLAREVVAGFTD